MAKKLPNLIDFFKKFWLLLIVIILNLKLKNSQINHNTSCFIFFKILSFQSYRVRTDLFASVVFRLGYVNSLDVTTSFHVSHRWKHLKHIACYVLYFYVKKHKFLKNKSKNAFHILSMFVISTDALSSFMT